MKKTFSILATLALCCGLLGACGGTSSSGASALSASASVPASSAAASSSAALAGVDDAAFVQAAKDALDLLNAGDYNGVVALFREDLQAGISGEALGTQLAPVFEELGAFKDFGDSEVVTGTDATLGDYIAVFIQCHHTEKTITWQVVYAPDMQLLSLLSMGMQ